MIRRPKKKRDVTFERFNALRTKGFDPGSGSPTNCSNSSAFPKRWPSSTGPLSSSPTSTIQESLIFDRLDGGDETSRPTSADSNFPPPWPKQSNPPPPFTILHTSEADGPQPGSSASPPSVPVPVPVPPLKRSVSHESLLSVPTVYLGSPALSESSYVSRAGYSPSPRHASVKLDDPQASVTPGIAIRDQPGSIGHGGSAYSRLLGLHRDGSSPPTNPSKPSSRKSSSTSNAGSGWFWKYVTLAPPGRGGAAAKPGRAQEPAPRAASKVAAAAWPAVGYVDEDLLRESLVEGPGLS